MSALPHGPQPEWPAPELSPAPEPAAATRASGLASAARTLVPIVLLGVVPVALAAYFLAAVVPRDALGLDFREAFWPAAHAVLHGSNPYPALDSPALAERMAYAYPPIVAIVLAPFGLLPVGLATAIAMLATVAALVGALWVMGVRDWRCYGASLASPVVLVCIQTAALSAVLALAVALAWRHRARGLATPLLIAAMIAAKLFLWPLLVWLAIVRGTALRRPHGARRRRRDRRALAGRLSRRARVPPAALEADGARGRVRATRRLHGLARAGGAVVRGDRRRGRGDRHRRALEDLLADGARRGVGPHADAVRDAGLEEAAHVLDGDLGGVVEQRGRLGAAVHREQRARRGADEHVRMLARGAQQAHEIGAHGLGGRQLRDHLLQLHDIAGRDDRIALLRAVGVAEAREQVALAVLGRVADAGAHREAVARGVRQLERAGVVVRVHGADAEERPRQRVPALADRDRVLLHGLEQARLHARAWRG